MKPISYIFNWAIIKDESLKNEDEINNHYLEGDVEFHPIFACAETIETSCILKIDWKNKLVETAEILYHLEGPPRLDYQIYLENNLVSWSE
jgi:hypothetical protein